LLGLRHLLRKVTNLQTQSKQRKHEEVFRIIFQEKKEQSYRH
jgi:hypothetical protein